MILIDLGNTNAKIFNGENITKIATADIIEYLQSVTEEVLLCSVVPRYNQQIMSMFPNVRLITNKDYQLMFNNDNKSLDSKGADRIVAAYSAVQKYGPKVVVVDIGTCVTIDVCNQNEYQSGLIYPGFVMLENLLDEKIEQLPKGVKEETIISTQSQIYHASIYGFVGALQNMIRQVRPSSEYNIIVTGGSVAKFIEEYNIDLLSELGFDNVHYEQGLIENGLVQFTNIIKETL